MTMTAKTFFSHQKIYAVAIWRASFIYFYATKATYIGNIRKGGELPKLSYCIVQS